MKLCLDCMRMADSRCWIFPKSHDNHKNKRNAFFCHIQSIEMFVRLNFMQTNQTEMIEGGKNELSITC